LNNWLTNCRRPACRGWLALLALLLLTGCPDPAATPVQQAGPQLSAEELAQLQNAPLRLLLVGSPALAEELKLQFEGRGDTTLAVETCTVEQWQTLPTADLSAYDVLLAPADRLVTLAIDGQLLKLAPAWLEKFPPSSWLPLERRVGRWEQDIFAVSLGQPLWGVMYHAANTADATPVEPPRTWSDWRAAVQRDLADGEPGAAPQWLESLAGDGPALAVLLRVVALAKSPAQTDLFFDRRTLEPRLTSPPFVQALEDLRATYGSRAAELKSLTPADLVARVSAGQAQAAILTLPRLDDVNAGTVAVKVAPPPVARRQFNFFDQSWTNLPEGGPASQLILGTGHAVAVLRKTRKSEAAVRLMELLVESPTAETFAGYNAAATPFRQEHLTDIRVWVGRQYSVDAGSTFRRLATLASDEVQGGAEWLPPLPGNSRRLAALTEAVWAVLQDEQEPLAALEACQQRWLEIAAESIPELNSAIIKRWK